MKEMLLTCMSLRRGGVAIPINPSVHPVCHFATSSCSASVPTCFTHGLDENESTSDDREGFLFHDNTVKRGLVMIVCYFFLISHTYNVSLLAITFFTLRLSVGSPMGYSIKPTLGSNASTRR
ncbi:hypothetical protein BDV40DRAFT_253651 [Aspergillus tamarii]|uniref:Uncharacterized protein n=1 Tax=Aspergillus tamarii TaxID=41984 RepID=A0A5N6V8B2_ASPTM|nr:hypothetical protein BDV40DRAFT_253651 [Aspergillus tamarii]